MADTDTDNLQCTFGQTKFLANIVAANSELQLLFDRFFNAAKQFGLTVSLKKTEAMCQWNPPSQTASVRITAGDNTVLKSVDKFCYLSSFLLNTTSADSDIASHLAKAGCAFGKLQKRLWGGHDISRETKVAMYQAVVIIHCCMVVRPRHSTNDQSVGWISYTSTACAT